MIWSITLSLVDLFGVALALFILGMMAGHTWLPAKINKEKEALISQLMAENFLLKNAQYYTSLDEK